MHWEKNLSNLESFFEKHEIYWCYKEIFNLFKILDGKRLVIVFFISLSVLSEKKIMTQW